MKGVLKKSKGCGFILSSGSGRRGKGLENGLLGRNIDNNDK
jgi:hypothetical protein